MIGRVCRDFLRSRPFLLAPIIGLRHFGRHRPARFSVRLSNDGERFVVRKGDQEIWLDSRHGGYANDVAREFDYYFESVLPEMVGSTAVADFSGPKRHGVRGFDHKFLFSSLPEGGSTNRAYLESLKLAPGDVVIDAGAYCGLTAHVFARSVGPTGLIIAIEADPRNYSALLENIEASGATNIRPVRAAVWTAAGTLQFQAEGSMGSSLSTTSPRHDALVDVRAATLLDICRELGVEKVDHVKMDIEGAEYAVVLSSTEFIERYRPDFIIEAHKDGESPVNVQKLANYFNLMGYTMTRLKQSEAEIFPLLYFAPVSEREGVGLDG